ncbi:hypothetical protein QTP88_016400 [Uroleucon formosanum]
MLGLINFTYTFDSGLLCKNSKNAMHYVCLELIRTTVLIGLTYIFHVNNTFYLRELVLFKFWTIVFMTRIYEIWIIRLINGIIEFDRRLDGLEVTIMGYNPVAHSPPSRYGWNTFLASLLASYIGLQVFSIWLWPPARLGLFTGVKYFFEIPCFTEFAVFATAYFFFHNLGSRFGTLSRFCERLPTGLVTAAAGTWTQSEIAETMGRVRSLHSELCDLLRVFGYGYGGVLLCYFAFNFVDLLRNFYYLVHVSRYDSSSSASSNNNTLNVVLTVTFCLQNVVFVVCLLIAVSWINEKIFILLTTMLATSVQMKEHPYVVRFNNAYQSYLRFEYKMS